MNVELVARAPSNRLKAQHAEHRHHDGALLSLVVPVYNEEDGLAELVTRISAVCNQIDIAYELVLVNDGSSDGSLLVMRRLKQQYPNIAIVNLSRNFGKEIALTAGLDHATGDLIAIFDADLQDPPELLFQMLPKWQEGYDVVYAQRESREGETWLKKKTAEQFYHLMQSIGPVRIPANTGDCRLMTRSVVQELSRFREHHRFMKGLFAWVGFNATAVRYTRQPRFAGKTKWNYWKLWNLALEAITSFTTIPLRITFYLGALVSMASIGYAFFILIRTLIYGDPVQGFPTLFVTILLLGGIELFALGLIGEYLGRVFNETKGRPLYILDGYDRREVLPAPALKGQATTAS